MGFFVVVESGRATGSQALLLWLLFEVEAGPFSFGLRCVVVLIFVGGVLSLMMLFGWGGSEGRSARGGWPQCRALELAQASAVRRRCPARLRRTRCCFSPSRSWGASSSSARGAFRPGNESDEEGEHIVEAAIAATIVNLKA